MKVKTLRGYFGKEGRIARDTVISVAEARGFQLIKRGLAAPVMAAPAETIAVEAVNPVRPTQTLPPGSQTGAETPSSSSAADHQPKTRRSRQPRGARASSSSMKGGASRPGPSSSMEPTAAGGDMQQELLTSKE